jgi:hypothetical protein
MQIILINSNQVGILQITVEAALSHWSTSLENGRLNRQGMQIPSRVPFRLGPMNAWPFTMPIVHFQPPGLVLLQSRF